VQSPTVRLFLAGSPHARPVHARDPVPLMLRDAGLLAWLAIEGPTHRGRLAALLWPDSDVEAARNSLRQRLFNLRKLLGGDVATGTTTLALCAGVEHDLHEADSVLGDDHHPYSEEFSRWLDGQRASRLDRARRRLGELADRAEAERDVASAIEHVQRLVAIDNLHEDGHARLIRLHYQSGDHAAALAAYDRCAALLREHLGTQPSSKLRELKSTIERAQPTAVPVRPVLPVGMLRPPRFVGRERELRLARTGWEANQVLVVTGEAGMGKTRLLQELVGGASPCAFASARPGDAAVPYSAMSRLLGAVVKAMPARFGGPGLVPALPGFPGSAPGDLSPHAAALQARVLGCVRDLLAAATDEGLQAAVLDDLHFADQATLELLAALTHGEERGELRLGFAYRPVEGEPALRRLEESLLDEQRAALVPLQPLDPA
jgi:DNA-binding SARP family transcriptional activator